MQVASFQAPISPSDRQRAWGWPSNLGAQPHDQHVRADLMRRDDLVLRQMALRYQEEVITQTGGWERF